MALTPDMALISYGRWLWRVGILLIVLLALLRIIVARRKHVPHIKETAGGENSLGREESTMTETKESGLH